MATTPTTKIASPSGTILSAGQSITGSFHGLIVLTTATQGNPAIFSALKDVNGNLLTGSNLYMAPGTFINSIIFTSASLAPGSSPVLIYS
jgi:hypothetical protein